MRLNVNVLLAVFALPAASPKVFAATLIDPEPDNGPDVVSVTVLEVPVVVREESCPRDTVKSEIVRSATLSFKVIVIVQVLPAAYVPVHPLREIVGATVS